MLDRIYLFMYSTSTCMPFLGAGERALNKTKLLMKLRFYRSVVRTSMGMAEMTISESAKV